MNLLIGFVTKSVYDYTLLIILFVGLPLLFLLIKGIIRLIKYFLEMERDRKMLRLEVGKLADELEQLRKQKVNVEGYRPDQSG